MSDILEALKEANPVLTVIVLVGAICAAVYLFRRLDAQSDRHAKALEDVVGRLTERLGLVCERVATLETNDRTRQHSLSDGSNRFAQLEQADQLMQDRYLKIAASCITKEDCARCNDGQRHQLDGLAEWMQRVEQHLTENDKRWMDLSQRIDARFEPLTRMLSEMIVRVGGGGS
jgi:hypothetical protein